MILINRANPLTLQKIKLLRTVFTIGNESTACNTLLLEIGKDYCCYALLKGEEMSFSKIKYISYEAIEEHEVLQPIFNEMKNEECSKVIVCSAFPQALLIPVMYSSAREMMLNSVYDLPLQKHFADSVPEWQLTASYSLPLVIFRSITARFPSAQFIHAYTPVLKINNGFVAPDQMEIYFSTRYFRLLLKKENQLQMAQTYSYKTPLDVVYYLLKICYEFHLQQSGVLVILSGLIDQDSAMYKELHSYFLNVQFARAPEFSIPENEYPHHYFTSLYNLAACVL